MNKKAILSAMTLATILAVSLLLLPNTPTSLSIGIVHAEDALDNAIEWVGIYQNETLLLNATATNQTVRIVGALEVNFTVAIRLNDTLASSDGEAISYTKVSMNLTFANNTAIWTDEELSNVYVEHVGDYYLLHESKLWSSDLPVDGATYIATIKYEAYY